MPILGKETSRYPDNVLEREFNDSVLAEGHRWWAYFTKPRQEKALVRDLHASGIPFYLPLVKKDNLIRGKRVSSHLPLFPAYVFALTDGDGRVQSMKTNRICSTLPVEEPEELRRDLAQLDLLIQAGVPLTIESRLAPGQRVRIRKGSLAGIDGIVLERRGRCRLLVAVHFLQSGVSLEIDDFMLDPV